MRARQCSRTYPGCPLVVSPEDGSVDPDNTVIKWNPVTSPPGLKSSAIKLPWSGKIPSRFNCRRRAHEHELYGSGGVFGVRHRIQVRGVGDRGERQPDDHGRLLRDGVAQGCVGSGFSLRLASPRALVRAADQNPEAGASLGHARSACGLTGPLPSFGSLGLVGVGLVPVGRVAGARGKEVQGVLVRSRF